MAIRQHKKFAPVAGKEGSDKREFDKTQLKEKGAGTYVHRDYAAHFFRWGFASNFINKDTLVLDVGCGQEMPMIKCLGRSVGTLPKHIVGVDLNKIRTPVNSKWSTIIEKFNVITEWRKLRKQFGKFDVITYYNTPDEKFHVYMSDDEFPARSWNALAASILERVNVWDDAGSSSSLFENLWPADELEPDDKSALTQPSQPPEPSVPEPEMDLPAQEPEAEPDEYAGYTDEWQEIMRKRKEHAIKLLGARKRKAPLSIQIMKLVDEFFKLAAMQGRDDIIKLLPNDGMLLYKINRHLIR